MRDQPATERQNLRRIGQPVHSTTGVASTSSSHGALKPRPSIGPIASTTSGSESAEPAQNFLVNSFGGDPFGLSQVCADREHYVGALFLEPEKWGESAVATIMRMANKMPYSSNVGVAGTEVTATNPIAGCK